MGRLEKPGIDPIREFLLGGRYSIGKVSIVKVCVWRCACCVVCPA